ncbi:MAG: hypothetical protein ACOCZ9_03125, partial [Spirochaetota bacterium]
RYISVIQPFMLLIVSFGVVSVSTRLRAMLRGRRVLAIALPLAIIPLVIPAQIPGVPGLAPILRTAQADWRHVEGARIHRRAMQPDNWTAYDYLFTEGVPLDDPLRIVRVSSSGIAWIESYYVREYLDRFPDTDMVSLHRASDGTVEERYRSDGRTTKSYESLFELDRPFFVVATIPDELSPEEREFLDTQGTDISAEVGVARGTYGTVDATVQEYFPHVWHVR